jgi:hypothetical protein
LYTLQTIDRNFKIEKAHVQIQVNSKWLSMASSCWVCLTLFYNCIVWTGLCLLSQPLHCVLTLGFGHLLQGIPGMNQQH